MSCNQRTAFNQAGCCNSYNRMNAEHSKVLEPTIPIYCDCDIITGSTGKDICLEPIKVASLRGMHHQCELTSNSCLQSSGICEVELLDSRQNKKRQQFAPCQIAPVWPQFNFTKPRAIKSSLNGNELHQICPETRTGPICCPSLNLDPALNQCSNTSYQSGDERDIINPKWCVRAQRTDRKPARRRLAQATSSALSLSSFQPNSSSASHISTELSTKLSGSKRDSNIEQQVTSVENHKSECQTISSRPNSPPTESRAIDQRESYTASIRDFCVQCEKNQSDNRNIDQSMSNQTNRIQISDTDWIKPAGSNLKKYSDLYRQRRNTNDGESSPALSDKLKHSSWCFVRLLFVALESVFPVFGSFQGYSLRRDLLGDFLTGLTVAVLQIPQGMAYGLLAGVEPNYGLYVSFVPVLILALMSKSRHMSYGTFAVVSMLLADTCNTLRDELRQEQQSGYLESNSIQITQFPASKPISSRPTRLVEVASLEDEREELAGGLMADQMVIATSSNVGLALPSNIEILTCICIIVGLMQILMSIGRLGILTLMFSDQLVSSFTSASAIHVITSQLGPLVDLDLPPTSEGLFKVLRTWLVFGGELSQNSFSQQTALLSVVSVIFLLTIKEIIEPRLKRRFSSLTCIPSELLLMSLVLYCSYQFRFQESFNIKVLGKIPTGLPDPQVPRLDLAPLLLKDSLVIALVSFSINQSLAKVYARRYQYKIDSNQELFALGTANVVGSFFHCFPCSSSLSRSAVQSNLNPKSQLCSIISCLVVFSITYKFAPILHDLPRSTLSCIIVVALKGVLIQVRDLHENWRLSKLDALIWAVTFISVLGFGVAFGLLVGILTSLFMIFVRILMPNHSILGQVPGTELFVNRKSFDECQELKNIKIFRFNSPLCYLNAAILKSRIERELISDTHQEDSLISGLFCGARGFNSDLEGQRGVKTKNEIKFLIIDCSGLAYCDYTGASTLIEVMEELGERKIQVFLAACPTKMVEMIERLNKSKVLEDNMYPHILDAVTQASLLIQNHDQSCSSHSCECLDFRCQPITKISSSNL